MSWFSVVSNGSWALWAYGFTGPSAGQTSYSTRCQLSLKANSRFSSIVIQLSWASVVAPDPNPDGAQTQSSAKFTLSSDQCSDQSIVGPDFSHLWTYHVLGPNPSPSPLHPGRRGSISTLQPIARIHWYSLSRISPKSLAPALSLTARLSF